MYQVPLTTVPNQALSFNLDGAFWTVRVFQAIENMCADITRNGTPIVTGVRCFSGIPLMPYGYMYMPNFGNFVFDGGPDWTFFDGRVNLFYLTAAEFAQYQSITG